MTTLILLMQGLGIFAGGLGGVIIWQRNHDAVLKRDPKPWNYFFADPFIAAVLIVGLASGSYALVNQLKAPFFELPALEDSSKQ